MTTDSEAIEVGPGMAAAVVAPALAGALLGLAGGPEFASAVFLFAFGIALAHVLLLALPLYGLIRWRDWPIRPGTVIFAAIAIGAVPATLRLGPEAALYGGLFGFIGGCAFCGFAYRGWVGGEM